MQLPHGRCVLDPWTNDKGHTICSSDGMVRFAPDSDHSGMDFNNPDPKLCQKSTERPALPPSRALVI